MGIWSKVVKEPSPEVLRQEVNISEWERIFQGKSDWLEYYEINVDGRKRKRSYKTLNTSKIVTQKMSSLVFSETPKVNGPKILLETLEDSAFWTNQQENFERQCALGSQAMKLYTAADKIYIDYVPADQFIPLTWDNKGIVEAAFLDFHTIKGKDHIRVEQHTRYFPILPVDKDDPKTEYYESKEPTGYRIASQLYKKTGDKVTLVDISGLMPEYADEQIIITDYPLFVYIKNPICNNWDSATPIGMSIYGNAKDSLQGLDIAFNNMAEAPDLCKPRIVVSDRLTRTVVNDDGTKTKYFDPQDRVFRTAPIDEDSTKLIEDLTIPLAHEPIRKSIQTSLDLLCIQVGFSTGTLSFDGSGGIKTATEVISENSETYRTRQKYINALEAGYIDLFNSIIALAQFKGLSPVAEEDISIEWDDSIIEDRTAEAAYWMSLSAAGLIPKYKAIMKIMKIEELEAKKIAEEVKADQPQINIMGA